MDVRLLGPVEASVDGRPVALGAGKPRALFALLALHAGSTVSSERLIDGLWGERPPTTAAKLVQVHVSQLRKALADAGDGNQIVTRRHGYELRLGPDDVDVRRFERLVDLGLPREALALWRGPPLDDVVDEPFAAPEIRRLEELRMAAVELAIERDLEAGRHREVVPELEALVLAEPLRERLHAQRMLALYRSGRQSAALDAYRHARTALVEQIGVEPGAALRRLHEAILRQDPALEPPEHERLELPPELDTSTPLVGRADELAWLRQRWRATQSGAAALVVIAGPRGMGKTRLAAELAASAVRDGAVVLYADQAPDAALAGAGTARGPTLLVLDDLDRAGEASAAALARLLERRPAHPLLALATAADPALTERLPGAARLDLAPLDAEGVRAVARLHAGGRAGGEPPVERLAAASGGVPGRLHRAAAEWARTLAVRRVGDTASLVAAERPVLRVAEDDLVADIVALQAARERVEDKPAERVVLCPFKGLAGFEVEDAALFFGRERLVAELVARLAGAPLMGIVGASGSGKSSVLRAGLLAALAAGVLPGSERWPVALLRPGERPLRALQQALAETLPDGRLLIAVDQFEETFTACADELERAAFADALVARARDVRRRTLVLVAVRADYYGRCAAYPELARLLGANHVLVGPMRRDELRRAIELPARRAGLRTDAGLADALIGDVEGEPGALPLLSTSLLELWQHRDGHALRLAAYEQAGGVHGAVARLAERAYERLDPAQRQVARRILLRLAGEGEGDAVVRRRVPLSELDADRDERAADVLSVLADDRLITVGEGVAEVSHEALLREWPRLRGWLEEDAHGRHLHNHLRSAAHDWIAGGHDPSELYRGARLASALDWIADHEQELNEHEREFLARSRAVAEREAERQRRANRRLRGLLAGIAALLALAIVAGVTAVSQRGQARDAAVVADAQRLGAEALTEERLERALLLARTGVALHESTATRGNLLSVLLRTPAALGVLSGTGFPINATAVSPDGRVLAIGDEGGTVALLDPATRRPLSEPYRMRGGLVQTLTFSPDGETLAVTGLYPPNTPPGAQVDLIDPRTGKRRLRVKLPRFPEPSEYIVAHVAFLPGGDLAAVQTHNQFPDPGAPPSVVLRLDGQTGAVESRRRIGRHASWQVSTSGDRVFVSSQLDDATYALDPRTLHLRRLYRAGGLASALSPDRRTLALGSDDGTVRLLDLRSGDVRGLRGRHTANVVKLAFAPDARTLVSSGGDGDVIAWDLARRAIRERFSGHEGQVYGLAISPDGRTVYSGAVDKRAIVWDLAGDRRLVEPFTAGRGLVFPTDLPPGLALSPDGRTLAFGHSDGTAILIDAGTLLQRARFRVLDGFVGALRYSPDGRLLAAAGEEGELTLWDARTLRPAGELRGLHGFLSQSIAFSPDGRLLASAWQTMFRSNVRVWDVRTRAPTPVRFGSDLVASIAFSPDGRLLATAAFFDGVQIRDARTGRRVATLPVDEGARSLAFSPDGSVIAVGRLDGGGRLWSTATWKPVGRPLEGHTGRILSFEFSPDGRTFATASSDGTVLLYETATQKPIGSPLIVDRNVYVATALSPDGAHLFAVSLDGRGVRFDLSPEAWKRQACAVAGRELTPGEGADALPDRPYRAVCSGG